MVVILALFKRASWRCKTSDSGVLKASERASYSLFHLRGSCIVKVITNNRSMSTESLDP